MSNDYFQPNTAYLNSLIGTPQEGIQEENVNIANNNSHVGIIKGGERSIAYTLGGIGNFALGVGSIIPRYLNNLYTGGSGYNNQFWQNVAIDNELLAKTTGDHPITNTIASAIPYIAADIISDGTFQLASLGEVSGQTIAKNTISNSILPRTFATKEIAKNIGVNEAIALQGSLELDQKGNVKVDTKALIDNSALGLGVAGVVEGAKLGFVNRNMTRTLDSLKNAKESYNIPDVPDTDETIIPQHRDISAPLTEEQLNTQQTTQSLIEEPPKLTQNEIDDLSVSPPKDILGDYNTTDLNINPTDDEDINKFNSDNESGNINYTSQDSVNHYGFYSSVNAVRKALKHGVLYGGERQDITSNILRDKVKASLKRLESEKLERGSKKLSLTKLIDKAPREAKDKYIDIINKARRMDYRSISRIEGKNNDTFLEFGNSNITGEDMARLKRDSAKEPVAKNLLALINQGHTNILDNDIATHRNLKKLMDFYHNGLYDFYKNADISETESLSEHARKVQRENLEYLSSPESTGYVKLSSKWDLEDNNDIVNLIGCLIGS